MGHCTRLDALCDCEPFGADNGTAGYPGVDEDGVGAICSKEIRAGRSRLGREDEEESAVTIEVLDRNRHNDRREGTVARQEASVVSTERTL